MSNFFTPLLPVLQRRVEEWEREDLESDVADSVVIHSAAGNGYKITLEKRLKKTVDATKMQPSEK